MRGILVSLLIFMWVPIMAFKPHIGILVWSWVSTMNPHQQAYGFVRSFPFLNFAAAATILGILLSKEKQRIPMHPIVVILVVYFLWVCVTTVLAMDPAESFGKFSQFSKSLLFATLSVAVMRSPNRLKAFLWVLALSMGYFGIKGGL